VALHSLVLSMGQSLLQNGLFQRGKVRSLRASDIALFWNAKSPCMAGAWEYLRKGLVAGAGFEPAAFRL
ncbi:hypothetical protein ACCT14_34705, partial [Rhizobium brockwellii]|uniref:hypothetical protein n=1 Tax=Rhizobium brockwellii TaxID=3019932 RepID=UPI003F9BC9E7